MTTADPAGRGGQTFKKSFTLDTGMVCPYCGEKQYVTQRSRKKNALYAFIAPVLLLLILFILIYLGVYPNLVELSNEEELPF
ncbi:hypothetical protein GCM10028778_23620 [Barrientosiimonas marina]|uniref:LITAF domain-containing protein n=1 Tax=Lentibacillus kimchii TaxID=1542911 RepID=A0ABW2UXC8_9BACI